MSAGKITRTQDREAARHTAAIAKLVRAEVKMVRAMRAWDKARLVVRRYDIKADKRFAEIPGKMDVRNMPHLGSGLAKDGTPCAWCAGRGYLYGTQGYLSCKNC